MLFKNLSQLSAVSGHAIQNSSYQSSNVSATVGESMIAGRGCCGGRRNRGNNIDIDIDIDINIGRGNRGADCC
ncbi:hypothetical protein DFA_04011 [Cavenderia fasciculata]|uniref:Uncharacterized protein n=1 Tax=Cavenderia fasciculata TaxID=261658 RepID=F4Q116_CACFS|nr:uncharacterized protein DFA_04011 [Cavenderia fasciculata]EGG18517.1 hypothetical protein DFA_04011 [Cavenderia fasciculata]|eukprot:XP_004366421.1 hypothetical protein DFA_04011 [Cavenderia fasciculata]